MNSCKHCEARLEQGGLEGVLEHRARVCGAGRVGHALGSN